MADLGALGMPVWSASALVALAVAAAVVDMRCGRVPNWLTYPAIVIALGGHGLAGGLAGSDGRLGLYGALAGLAVGFGPLLLCWLAGGIGGGDAKLMGAIGALGGMRFAIGAMMYGFIVAALMAVVVMIRKRVVVQTLRRVWHTLALLVMPGAKPADPTGKDSPQIPFAVALCVGTLATMAEAWYRRGL